MNTRLNQASQMNTIFSEEDQVIMNGFTALSKPQLKELIDSGELSQRETQLARYVYTNGASMSDPNGNNNTNNGIYCLLMTDADGNVGLTTDITPRLPSGTFDMVFKRNANNASDSYFATASGQPSTVSNMNFLRVGATNNSSSAQPQKPDTAMVVAGVVESRGGLLIRKNNNNSLKSNEGENLNTVLENSYSDLDLNITNGKVNFISSNFDNGFGNTSFIFSALNNQTKLGINNATPTKTLDVVGNAGVTQYLTVGHPANFVPTTTDILLVNGSTRANAYYYNSDRRYKSKITLIDNALEKLSSLHGYRYYNKLSEKNDIGVIAQEVEKAFPELVQTDTQ